MLLRLVLQIVLFTSFTSGLQISADQPKAVATPPNGKVFFITPKEGDVVGQEFKIKIGAEGLKILPTNKKEAGSGHHNIVIKGGWISSGSIIPKDGNHIRLDNAETESSLKLAPGEYTITVQFSDSDNVSYGQSLSQTIHIKVQ